MRTIFETRFDGRRTLSGPRLGQWETLVSSLITAAGAAYGAREAREAAEEAREAAEARAAAERAKAEAEKAELEEQRLRAVQAEAEARVEEAKTDGTILGIPKDIALYGGLGLGALLLVVVLAS